MASLSLLIMQQSVGSPLNEGDLQMQQLGPDSPVDVQGKMEKRLSGGRWHQRFCYMVENTLYVAKICEGSYGIAQYNDINCFPLDKAHKLDFYLKTASKSKRGKGGETSTVFSLKLKNQATDAELQLRLAGTAKKCKEWMHQLVKVQNARKKLEREKRKEAKARNQERSKAEAESSAAGVAAVPVANEPKSLSISFDENGIEKVDGDESSKSETGGANRSTSVQSPEPVDFSNEDASPLKLALSEESSADNVSNEDHVKHEEDGESAQKPPEAVATGSANSNTGDGWDKYMVMSSKTFPSSSRDAQAQMSSDMQKVTKCSSLVLASQCNTSETIRSLSLSQWTSINYQTTQTSPSNSASTQTKLFSTASTLSSVEASKSQSPPTTAVSFCTEKDSISDDLPEGSSQCALVKGLGPAIPQLSHEYDAEGPECRNEIGTDERNDAFGTEETELMITKEGTHADSVQPEESDVKMAEDSDDVNEDISKTADDVTEEQNEAKTGVTQSKSSETTLYTSDNETLTSASVKYAQYSCTATQDSTADEQDTSTSTVYHTCLSPSQQMTTDISTSVTLTSNSPSSNTEHTALETCSSNSQGTSVAKPDQEYSETAQEISSASYTCSANSQATYVASPDQDDSKTAQEISSASYTCSTNSQATPVASPDQDDSKTAQEISSASYTCSTNSQGTPVASPDQDDSKTAQEIIKGASSTDLGPESPNKDRYCSEMNELCNKQGPEEEQVEDGNNGTGVPVTSNGLTWSKREEIHINRIVQHLQDDLTVSVAWSKPLPEVAEEKRCRDSSETESSNTLTDRDEGGTAARKTKGDAEDDQELVVESEEKQESQPPDTNHQREEAAVPEPAVTTTETCELVSNPSAQEPALVRPSPKPRRCHNASGDLSKLLLNNIQQAGANEMAKLEATPAEEGQTNKNEGGTQADTPNVRWIGEDCGKVDMNWGDLKQLISDDKHDADALNTDGGSLNGQANCSLIGTLQSMIGNAAQRKATQN